MQPVGERSNRQDHFLPLPISIHAALTPFCYTHKFYKHRSWSKPRGIAFLAASECISKAGALIESIIRHGGKSLVPTTTQHPRPHA